MVNILWCQRLFLNIANKEFSGRCIWLNPADNFVRSLLLLLCKVRNSFKKFVQLIDNLICAMIHKHFRFEGFSHCMDFLFFNTLWFFFYRNAYRIWKNKRNSYKIIDRMRSLSSAIRLLLKKMITLLSLSPVWPISMFLFFVKNFYIKTRLAFLMKHFHVEELTLGWILSCLYRESCNLHKLSVAFFIINPLWKFSQIFDISCLDCNPFYRYFILAEVDHAMDIKLSLSGILHFPLIFQLFF